MASRPRSDLESTVPTAARALAARLLGRLLLTALVAAGTAQAAESPIVVQRVFASPTQASEALIAALRSGDDAALLQVLGPQGKDLIQSGDPVADANGREQLLRAYDAAHRLESGDRHQTLLLVGAEEWPMPIAMVREDSHWRFDTEASVQKILDRRVGRNELDVIEVCRAYVTAQRQFAGARVAAGRPREFATRLQSRPGQHDGLYWEAAQGQPQSPLGPLVARARAEGYAGNGTDGDEAAPYHGYYYRILTSQGAHAPGGQKDYVVSGRMTRGFALLAYPAKWGDSGIMTFIVNQDGIVFEKNLGPQTTQIARAILQFDPDLAWRTP